MVGTEPDQVAAETRVFHHTAGDIPPLSLGEVT